MARKTNADYIEELQDNSEVVILNNPLATPSFIRQISKSKRAEVNEVYTPKIFFEIASRLKPSDLKDITRNTNIVMTLEIKNFLKSIQTTNTSGYSYLIESIKHLQTTLVEWVEGKETIVVPIITQSVHKHDSGKIDLYVSHDLARQILQVKETQNFSFFKKNVFALQTTRSIKLFPFLSSWKNYGRPIEVDLKVLKDKLGFNKTVYTRYASFKKHVLDPGILEINEKTDLFVKYEPLGTNLESKKPRVTGIRFYIQEKKNIKMLQSKARAAGSPTPSNVETFVEIETVDFRNRFIKHSQEFYDRILSIPSNREAYLRLLEKFQGTQWVNELNMFNDTEMMMKEFFRFFPFHSESMRSITSIRGHIEQVEKRGKEAGFLLHVELDEDFALKVTNLS